MDVIRADCLLADFYKRLAALIREVSNQLQRTTPALRPASPNPLAWTTRQPRLDNTRWWTPWYLTYVWLDAKDHVAYKQNRIAPQAFVALFMDLRTDKKRTVPELDFLVVDEYRALKSPKKKKAPASDSVTRFGVQLIDDVNEGIDRVEIVELWGQAQEPEPVEEWYHIQRKVRHHGACEFAYHVRRVPLNRVQSPEDLKRVITTPVLEKFQAVRAQK